MVSQSTKVSAGSGCRRRRRCRHPARTRSCRVHAEPVLAAGRALVDDRLVLLVGAGWRGQHHSEQWCSRHSCERCLFIGFSS